MTGRLSRIHPGILLLYCMVILIAAGFCYRPAFQVAALVSAILSCALLLPSGQTLRTVGFYCIPAVLIALTNPLFSHSGTPLFYINQMAITKEALYYGISMGVAFVSILCWFRVLTEILPGERMLDTFGGRFPKISMLLCVTLRTVPLLRTRIRETRQAQKALGLYGGAQGYVGKVRQELQIFKTVLSDSGEDAIQRGDSMRARGYGQGKRTVFRVKSFAFTDGLLLLGLIVMTGTLFTPYGSVGFALLCMALPICVIAERIRWKCLVSRI